MRYNPLLKLIGYIPDTSRDPTAKGIFTRVRVVNYKLSLSNNIWPDGFPNRAAIIIREIAFLIHAGIC